MSFKTKNLISTPIRSRMMLPAAASAAMLIQSALVSSGDCQGKDIYYDGSQQQSRQQLPQAPPNAPNVLVWMIDDAGFGQPTCYGGMVDTPTMDRLSEKGLRYTNFHSTALSSPSRASLLTGRNHHAVGIGYHSKAPKNFPGYNAHIPPSAACIAQILKDSGYATYCIGKWDHIHDAYAGPNGPFDFWPSGQGFEHFYGFVAADTDHFRPQVYQDHTPLDPALGRKDYHFTTDMADRAIESIGRLKNVTPNRPFFMYWATGAVHAPHQAPQSYIDKYRGRFDMGWDKAREKILERQKELGLVPSDTKLPPRAAEIPAWDSLSPEGRRMAARQMEVFAAMLEHADYEFGRLLKALESNGELDNTLIIVVSDNGASSEGSPLGSYNEHRFMNGLKNTLELNLKNYDAWGGPETYPHYSAGWAMAGNTPFKYYKFCVFEGGVRVPAIISWNDGKINRNELRRQFHHINDITPTILDAIGIEQPKYVNGVRQDPFDGVSMAYSFKRDDIPTPKGAQYFEIGGNRAIWADGWKAVVNHYQDPWNLWAPGKPWSEDIWELYHVAEDFNEMRNMASENPQKLEEMKQLFDREARKNKVYPLMNRMEPEMMRAALNGIEDKIQAVNGTYTYSTPGSDRIQTFLAPPTANRSHTITANIEVSDNRTEGVLVSVGGQPGGYSFYMLDGYLMYTYNYLNEKCFDLRSRKPVSIGRHKVRFVFEKTGPYQGNGKLLVDDEPVADGKIDNTIPAALPLNETFDVGCDHGSPVSPNYQSPFTFRGNIEKVEFHVEPNQLRPKK